jgi:hypothetical protein
MPIRNLMMRNIAFQELERLWLWLWRHEGVPPHVLPRRPSAPAWQSHTSRCLEKADDGHSEKLFISIG